MCFLLLSSNLKADFVYRIKADYNDKFRTVFHPKRGWGVGVGWNFHQYKGNYLHSRH